MWTQRDFFDAPCGLVDADAEGTIARVNRAVLEWTQYEAAALRGRPVSSLFTRAGEMFYETHIRPMLGMQGFVNEISLELRPQRGRPLPVLVNFARRVDAPSTGLRVALFRAVHRHRYENELLKAGRQGAEERAQRLSDVASMGHEVRSALNVIIGAGELLHSSNLDDDQREVVDVLNASADSLLLFVDRVLESSQLERGAFSMRAEAFSPADVVSGLAAQWSVAARKKNLDLRVAIDPQIPAHVIGDPMVVRQALSNLLANAIKFTSVGYVVLEMTAQEQSADFVAVEFRVIDTGSGIPEEERAALFEEFQRGRSVQALREEGVGLGLAIARRLVMLHGGTLHVASELHHGSMFWFILRFSRHP